MKRREIADRIVESLESNRERLKREYQDSEGRIGHFVLDDLLPEELARNIFDCFPAPDRMRLNKSLREYKYIAAQMDACNPILEEAIYAFQDARVVNLVSGICGIKSLHPDEHLYAGGISLMTEKQFLNPHLDNSHDKDRNQWRVLNLLYYVTPGWEREQGGNLELWPDGLNGEPVTLHSRFNRLAVMATHDGSWHSVSPISAPGSNRCCVSNYYFSDFPLKKGEEFHVTSFRGRPGQKVRDLVLRADGKMRMALRKLFRLGIVENKHVYKK